MNPNEEYLERLLRSITEPDADTTEETAAEPDVSDVLSESETISELELAPELEPEAEVIPEPEPEVINEPEPEYVPEPAPAFVPSDDPNHVMTPEEIAALIAGTSVPVEEPAPEPEVIPAPEPEVIPAPEPAPAFVPSDDPNHVMTPEEIAALIAGTSAPVEEPAPEPEVASEPEPAPAFEPSDDPNHVMTPEEIAALIAGTSAPSEETAPEEESAIEAEAEVELEAEPEIQPAGILDDEPIEAIDESMMPSEESLADLLDSIPELEANDQDQYSLPEGLNMVDFGLETDKDSPDEIDIADIDSGELSETDELFAGADDMDAAFAAAGDDVSDLEGLLGDSDSDMLAMLENADSGMPDEDDGDGEDSPIDFFSEDGLDDMDSDGAGMSSGNRSGSSASDDDDTPDSGEKKPGFFARLIAMLFSKKNKDDEDSADSDLGQDGVEYENPAGAENIAILEELDALDEEPKAPKKEKKKKEKKPKKEKKKKEKKKKEKKPKKERKPKVKPEDNQPVGKRISKKFIIAIVIVCGSFIGLVIFAVNKLPGMTYASEAREAFGKGDYETVYNKLVGLDLEGDDENLYQKSFILMKMKRYGERYAHWNDAGEKLQALDVLVQAVNAYDLYNAKAEEYGVASEYEKYYSVILSGLDEYGLDEGKAREFAAISDEINYSIALEDFLFGPQVVEPNIPQELLDDFVNSDEEAQEESEETNEGDNGSSIEFYDDDSENDAWGQVDEDGNVVFDAIPEGEAGESSEAEDEGENSNSTPKNENAGNVAGSGDEELFSFDVQQDSDGKYHAGN